MVNFQLLDVDYFLLNSNPVIRMFGRTENGNSLCVFYDNFLPYFYIRCKKPELEKMKAMKEIKNIEEVEKFIPLGYSKEPETLYKLTIDQFKVFSLTKISSKNFAVNPETSFRWGAGLFIAGDQSIQILATPEHIDDPTKIHIYE